MFNMYRRQFYRRSRLHAGSEEELGHDRFNYMNPNVNYDKWPRRLRPKKNSLKVELEAPESPHNMQEQHHQYASDATHNSTTVFNCETTYQRHCNGSLREHQRLLNLRSSRHKCSPRCRVKGSKSTSQNLSTEALVKVFACLGVQDGPNAAGRTACAATETGSGCTSGSSTAACGLTSDHHQLNCQHQKNPKRPKRLSVFSHSLSSFRYSSRMNKDFGGSSNGRSDSSSVGLDTAADASISGSAASASSSVGGPLAMGATAAGVSSASAVVGSAGGVGGIELREMDHKKTLLQRGMMGDSREMATNICRQYIRSSSRYFLLDHLPDIGSRIEKHWFMIRDGALKTERLLTIVPLTGSAVYGCDVTTTDADATRNALVDLFTALQHPYIYPVLDVDFVYGAVASSSSNYNEEAKPVLVTVFPFNSKGSLKDLIYRSRWQDDWGQKYRQRSEGLPLLQVQRLGRQILEALLFLQEKGFPPFGHLHSGNVIIQNGVARLTGFENTLLGFSSRIQPLVKNILPGLTNAVDTICFGHVLFEMCSGYELYAPKPTARHLDDLQSYPQVVEVLDYIFNSPCDDYPSIANLSILEFFRNIDLREMRCSTMYYNAKLTNAAANLLEQVQQKRRRRENYLSQMAEEQKRQQQLQQQQQQQFTAMTKNGRHKKINYCTSRIQYRLDEAVEGVGSSYCCCCSGRQMDNYLIEEEGPSPSTCGEEVEIHMERTPTPTTATAAEPVNKCRHDLSLHLCNGGVAKVEPSVVALRPRRTVSGSRTTPSLMLASLISLDSLRNASVPEDSELQTPTNTPNAIRWTSNSPSTSSAAQRFSHCSEDSFQTPLGSPSIEWDDNFYCHNNNVHQAEEALAAISSATAKLIVTENGSTHLLTMSSKDTPTTSESVVKDTHPRVVLTPPEVNEAFSMEEYATLV